MKRFVVVFVATLLSIPIVSHAQVGDFYVQFDGGASFLGETDLGDGVDAEYDVGYVVGGRLGARVADAFRIEFDLAYSSNEFDEVNGIDLGSFGLDADLTALTFGVGAYVDVLPYGVVEPYIGAGIGGAYKEIDTNFGADDDATDLAAHGEVGLSFDMTPNIAVVPHYRLLWLDGVGEDEQFAHWLRVGLRLSQ